MGILDRIFGSRANRVKVADRTTVGNLPVELEKLKTGNTKYDFLGITSNGLDCIYFARAGANFIIEYEAMSEEQLPYIERLKAFAMSNGFDFAMSSYGNKPHFDSEEDAPVLVIETNSNSDRTAEIAGQIQETIFNNNRWTEYGIVP